MHLPLTLYITTHHNVSYILDSGEWLIEVVCIYCICTHERRFSFRNWQDSQVNFPPSTAGKPICSGNCREGRYSRRELDGTNDLVPCVPICLIAYAWNIPFGDDLQDYRNDPARLEQVVTNRCTQRVPNDPPTRNDDLVAWIVIWWSARC